MKLPFQQALVELSRQALVGTAKTVERGVSRFAGLPSAGCGTRRS